MSHKPKNSQRRRAGTRKRGATGRGIGHGADGGVPMKNSKQVMVRIPPELYERLKYVADLRMTTPSAMARLFIKQRIDHWDREWEFVTDQGGDTDNPALPKLLR